MIKLVLFFNNSTNGSLNAPYFTGKLTMEDGTELKTALWTNVSGAGVTYYSGHAKPFEPNPVPVQAEGYRNYTPPTAPAQPDPAQPDPAPAAPEPVQDQPADPEFIQEIVKEWEDRTKADIPDLGRRKLEPPQSMDNNAFLKRLKYNESKALINTFVNTPIDDITAELAGQYYEAKTYVDAYEAEKSNLFPN
jgi:hypothetical protein